MAMPAIASVMILVYGIIIISMILDLQIKEWPQKKRVIAFTSAITLVSLNGFAMYHLGQSRYGLFYPLLVQLPLYIGFSVISPYKGVKVLFVLLSTIIFVAPPLMCVIMLRTFYQIGMPTSLVTFFCCYALMIFFVYRFLKTDFNYMLKNCVSRHFWLFCLIPTLHYVYSYARTGYNFVQPFAQDGFFVMQIPTVIVFASYILLIRVFRNTREVQILQNENDVMNLHLESAELRLYELQRVQEQTAAYRHDMRHHLSLLSGFAAVGEMDKVRVYLSAALADIEELTPNRYCGNDIANLILSSFAAKAKKASVTLRVDAKLPASLALSAPEFCSLLSNALENAIAAASAPEDETLRNVYVKCRLNHDKLLISTENAYIGEIELENELPKSKKIGGGHGLGMKSILAIVNRYNGLFSFETTGGTFVLRIMLPLGQ